MKLITLIFLFLLLLMTVSFNGADRFWKPIFGKKSLEEKVKEENVTGTLILDYCSVLTPYQSKLANLFIIVSKKYSVEGMSLLDACYVVYVLRDGYFSGCTKAIELTMKEDSKLRERRHALCKDVAETALLDADIRDLVREAPPEEIQNVIQKVESTLLEKFSELGGESCSMLSEEEISIANALVVILFEEGHKLSRTRACTVLLSLKNGSLEDCAKALRSALRDMIEYTKAEGFCQEMGRFASKKSPILSKISQKKSSLSDEISDSNTKLKIEANEAILVALAIDNRCHLDENDVKQILFIDYPSSKNAVDRRQLFDRFLTFYNRNKVSSIGKKWFKRGVLTELEEEENKIPLNNKMDVINLTNQQALQTLYSTYRNLLISFKETQSFVQEVYYQRRSIPESLKKRFYLQIQLIKYMEKHIGALTQHIELDNTDIFSASNLPYSISDLKQFTELGEQNWIHSLTEDKPYDEMDHFSLFCPLLHKSAFRLALLVVGIAHSVLRKNKVKLPDACLAITQLKNGKDFKSSIKMALATVFVKNQKILELEDLDTMYYLLINAVNESVNEFLLGIPEEFFSFENEDDITDERLKSWIAQVEHRLTKVINEPKAILGNISLFDVDMIMQSISPLEAKLQLLIGVSIRRIHETLIELTNLEHEIRELQKKIDFARIRTDHSEEIELTKKNDFLTKDHELLIQKVIDLVVEHAGYCAKAINIFDISDRPIVRKIHRIIAVNTEYRRLSSSYTKAIQNTPIYKSNKFLLKTSIIRHRRDQAKKILTELALGEYYNVYDTRWYTDIEECFDSKIPDLNLKLNIDPKFPLEESSKFKRIDSNKKPSKYNLLCNKHQIKRFKKVQADLIKIFKETDIPIIDFEGKRPLMSDILTLEGWAPLKTTIEETEEPNIPCSISKQLFKKLVSDLSQRVIGGTSYFNIPLLHLWCADHIRFRRSYQNIWRNIISRIWLIFVEEPLDIKSLQARKWMLLTWFR